MCEHLPNGNTRWRELVAALGNVLSTRSDYRLVSFSHECLDAPKPSALHFFGGGTMLANALEACASNAVERVLIVTDGEPSDMPPERALEVLESLYAWVRVDVLYVGTPGGYGEKLMAKVARGGGALLTTRLDYLGGIRLLLEGGK
jgi:hypothetical protein